jgi:hypothetical protein
MRSEAKTRGELLFSSSPSPHVVSTELVNICLYTLFHERKTITMKKDMKSMEEREKKFSIFYIVQHDCNHPKTSPVSTFIAVAVGRSAMAIASTVRA